MQLPDEGKMDLSQEGVEEFNAEFQENRLTRADRKRRKRNRRIALTVALAIATGAVGGHLAHQLILNERDYSRVAKLTNSYRSESVCLLPTRVLTTQNHDYVYSSGKTLVDVANNNHLSIIRIGDKFITPNGESVAKVKLKIEVQTFKPIEMYEIDGQTFYSEPNGYNWSSAAGSCVNTETKIIETYVFASNDHYYYNAPYPNSKVVEVLEYEEYPSITPEAAKEMKLIVDVKDDFANSDGSYYNEAVLRLVPNNQK